MDFTPHFNANGRNRFYGILDGKVASNQKQRRVFRKHESIKLDFYTKISYKNKHALVAQLDRVLPSEGKGREFESRQVRHKKPHLMVGFFCT